MKKIGKIRIKNFKAFPELQEFDLKGKNLLVCGNNGSGKSSLYWALYTILQCSEKEISRINEYFAIYDEAVESTYQSLRNIFSDEKESYVEIELQGELPIRISYDKTVGVRTRSVKEANKASDFINYKLLNSFYNSMHKQQLNLWNVFERDIFPYFSKPETSISTQLYDIYNNLPKDDERYYRRNSVEYKQYQQKIANFNHELQVLIKNIETQSNKILKEKFKIKDIEIVIDYDDLLKWDNNKSREFSKPIIKLSIKIKKNAAFVSNHCPQSFLNEAAIGKF